jgi:ABC-type amino acid transport system permease subunit
VEYASRVAQYYASYVSVALLYIACAVALHMAVDIISKQRAHSH